MNIVGVGSLIVARIYLAVHFYRRMPELSSFVLQHVRGLELACLNEAHDNPDGDDAETLIAQYREMAREDMAEGRWTGEGR